MADLQPLVFWTDASCYEAQGIAAIAVVDQTKKVVASRVIDGCRSSVGAEIEALKLGMRLARHLRPPIELRSDSTGAVNALTPPNGVTISYVRRRDNLADDAAHSLAREALAEGKKG
jgi:hypothetical protein